MTAPSLDRYCVVAFLDPAAVADRIARRAWPAHVTLASNFVTAAPLDELESVVRRVATPPMSFRCTETAFFGPGRDIPVRMVESREAVKVHADLMNELERLSGFVPDEPGHWRRGYRPHVTLGPEFRTAVGQVVTASVIALARLDGGTAHLVAVVRGAGVFPPDSGGAGTGEDGVAGAG